MQNLHPANFSADSHNNEHAAEKRGLRFERYFTQRGVHRWSWMGKAHGNNFQWKGRKDIWATGCRNSQIVVDDGNQRCCFKIFPWSDRDSAARNKCASIGGSGCKSVLHMGTDGWILCLSGRRRYILRWTDLSPCKPIYVVQQSGVVQCRRRRSTAMFGMLYQLREGFDVIHFGSCQDGRHAV